MPIYYVVFRALPNQDNQFAATVASAKIHVWIDASSPQVATSRSELQVERWGWIITASERSAAPATTSDLDNKDLERDARERAASTGISIVIQGFSRDGKTRMAPLALAPVRDFDLGAYLKDLIKVRDRLHCLFHRAGSRCQQPIEAHSIQRNGGLARIASDGHVYAISRNHSDYRKRRGKPTLTLQGINRVSTFRGFCAKHDASVFREIDAEPLVPTSRQALLYGYRSLCREIVVKENAASLATRTRDRTDSLPLKNFFESMRRGSELALRDLKRHRRMYEQSLAQSRHGDVKYVVFASKQPPTVVFSGLTFPDYDFTGAMLQDVYASSRRDLLTFCSADFEGGWAAVFCWHKSSDPSCSRLITSLVERWNGNERDMADHLFRFVMLSSENVAVAPAWWNALDESRRNEILTAIGDERDPFADVASRRISDGLEAICDWSFDHVIDSEV